MATKPALRVPQEKSPSLFNRTALVGLGIGAMLTPVAGIFLPLGIAAGSFMGLRREKHEQVHGKEVKPPRLLNSGLVFGPGIGFLATVLIGGAIALSTGGVGLFAAGIAALCSPIVGAIAGSLLVRHAQSKEYAAAEAYVTAHGEFQPQQPGQHHGIPAPQQQVQQGRGSPQTQVSQAGAQLDPKQLAQLQQLVAEGQQMAATQPPQGMADQLAQRHNAPQHNQRG